MKRIVLSIVLVLFIVLAWNSCVMAAEPEYKITSYQYSVNDVMDEEEVTEIEVGKSLQLYAIATVKNDSQEDVVVGIADEEGLIEWESTNASIATVDTMGKVTAVAAGQTTIKGSFSIPQDGSPDLEVVMEYEITVRGSEPTENPNPQVLAEPFTDIDAKIERYSYTHAQLVIKNITYKDPTASYYIYLSSTNSVPTVSSRTDLTIENGYFEVKNQYTSGTNTNEVTITNTVSDRVERSGDIYMFIVRYTPDTSEYRSGIDVCTEGIKLEKPAVPIYVEAFSSSSHLADGSTQIITNYVHDDENQRKMQIKIGKITDQSILLKIKNQDSTGFSDLLTFAKNHTGVYDKVVDANPSSAWIEYLAYNTSSTQTIDLKKKLDDKAYYFLYVKTLDENGKWVSNESVTLAQASVFGASQNDSWYLFFYGEDSFKWVNFSDPTVAPTKIPQTGQNVIIAIAIVSVVGLGVYTYRRLKNYRDVI